MTDMDLPQDTAARIASIRIDDSDMPAPTPEAEQERNIAVFDLLEGNRFRMLAPDAPGGPYVVTLAARERRLLFSIAGAQGRSTETALPLSAFRRLAREYHTVCDSYFDAVRTRSAEEIERLDEGRKALHNEGAEELQARLADAIEIDANTARRLFTLVCSLLYRG